MIRDLPILHGTRVVLRPLQEGDATPLLALLAEDSVREFWGTFDQTRFHREFIDYRGNGTFVVEVDGQTAGAAVFDEETDPDYRRASVDIFLGTSFQDRGIGSDALRTLARYLFDQLGHHAIDIDPAVSNARAVAAYEKVGFKRVGVRRKYERIEEEWHDSLLMDLLPEDLSDG